MPPFQKRFGLIAVEKGFITADQLVEAFKVQVLSEYVTKLGGSNWLFIIKLIKLFVTYTEKIEEYQKMIL